METAQQEHGAAIQSSLATPASLSALEKMPAEIILMIGSKLCPHGFHAPSELMVATLVSKRLRTVLLPRRFKNLIFSGSLKKLAQDMRSLLSSEFKDMMMTTLSTSKSVTIRFEPYTTAEKSTDSHLSTHRIAAISKCIAHLSTIDLISFDDQIVMKDIDFAVGLGSTAKWNGPKAVNFCGRRNDPIFKALINQFAPNTVKTVQLPSQIMYRNYLTLESACPLLKGLKADLSSFTSCSQTLACMSSNNLQEWKNNYVDKLITQLKLMPRLRRFAFTIEKHWLCMEYRCRPFDRPATSSKGDESNDPIQATPGPDDWPYWLPTYAQQDLWWSELIARILKAVPQLKELCIVHSSSKYHQATKTEDNVTVCLEEIAYLVKPSRFPYVLADID
ncbi:hypothetical protein F52700_1143 [Fusarium sp. NRRL 52700]|nr:hypothetical protein F52700_1143 [Fusarium sp. NRRL 52700]